MNPENDIRPAPLSFTRDSFTYRQVWREGMLAIYSQEKHGKIVAYEVVKLRVRAAHPLAKDQRKGESYPSSEDWGVYGWTCLTLEAARAKAKAKSPTV